MKKCKIDGCQNSAIVRGYCERHYRKLRRRGKLEKIQSKEKRKKCEVEGCKNASKVEGLCSKHYNRLKKYGQYEKPTVCSVEGCNNPVIANWLCNTHYLRWKRGGKLSREYERRESVCSVEGCNRSVYAKNLCNKHWQRKRNYGDVARDALEQPWRNNESWNDYFARKTKLNNKTGCIEWTAYRDNDGYGRGWKENRPIPAHRLSYEIFIGPIPEGKLICHHCDNPSCVNTDHLYAGTHEDNVRDKKERGRSNILTGEKSASSKLTEEQAIELIRYKKSGVRTDEIADKFGVSYYTVMEIVRGRSWKHLNRDSIESFNKNVKRDSIGRIESNTQTKLSESQVKQIKTKLNKGSSLNQLAIEFNVSKKLISNIKKGVAWNHVQPRKVKRRKRKI